MTSSPTLRSWIAVTAWLSVPLAFGSVYLSLAAVGFDFAALADPAAQVGIGAGAAVPVYRSMILDLFGYYLLVLPAAIYLWLRLRERSPFGAALATLCGVGYVLVGAIGAAILAAVLPPLLRDYATASGAAREQLATLFAFASNLVHKGLWNSLEVCLAGVWWSGIGALTWRARRAFAAASWILGAACVVDAAGTIAGWPPVAAPGLDVYLVLAPPWAGWLGVLAWQGAFTGPERIPTVMN